MLLDGIYSLCPADPEYLAFQIILVTTQTISCGLAGDVLIFQKFINVFSLEQIVLLDIKW